ncbi:MAG: hypothetical protein OXF09_06350, partial [Hyphomicrobiales bacterium]|nr:hypothetical protein [Hyphomicrobiales bacterium]
MAILPVPGVFGLPLVFGAAAVPPPPPPPQANRNVTGKAIAINRIIFIVLLLPALVADASLHAPRNILKNQKKKNKRNFPRAGLMRVFRLLSTKFDSFQDDGIIQTDYPVLKQVKNHSLQENAMAKNAYETGRLNLP